MQHIMNCHGEWNILFACATSLPFLGAWIKIKLKYNKENL